MDADPSLPPVQRFDVEMTAEVEVGLHSDFVSLWHTSDSIVLDFASLRRPPYIEVDTDGTRVAVAPTRVVARLRLPPSQVWELMRALEKELTAYENETGRKMPPPGE